MMRKGGRGADVVVAVEVEVEVYQHMLVLITTPQVEGEIDHLLEVDQEGLEDRLW